MLSLPLAVFVVVSTLVLVAAIMMGYFAIRRRLLDDPDLMEFIERVDAGKAERESGVESEAEPR